MEITSLIRALESQLKKAEKLTREYDTQAQTLRNKLADVAGMLGKKAAVTLRGAKPKTKTRKKRKMSRAGLAKIRAAQKKRWAEWKKKHRPF